LIQKYCCRYFDDKLTCFLGLGVRSASQKSKNSWEFKTQALHCYKVVVVVVVVVAVVVVVVVVVVVDAVVVDVVVVVVVGCIVVCVFRSLLSTTTVRMISAYMFSAW